MEGLIYGEAYFRNFTVCATKTVQFNSLRKAIKAECNTIVIIHIRTTLFKLGNIVIVI